MIINPSINESNLPSLLNIGKDDGFITECGVLSNELFLSWYGWAVPSVVNVLSSSNATEWRKFLPDVQEAREKFAKVGLDCQEMVDCRLVRFMTSSLRCLKGNPYKLLPTRFKTLFAKLLSAIPKTMRFLKHNTDESFYPLSAAPGCADFFVIPKSAAKEFFHSCGVFAAMRNFVEIAIPTAMALTCSGIKVLKDTHFKSDPPGDCGRRISEELEGTYHRSYRELVKNFPDEYLYIHPIKLSKWRDFV